MKVTIELREEVFKELENMRKKNGTTITQGIENALLIGTQKRILIQRLLDETCDEFDNALSKLAS